MEKAESLKQRKRKTNFVKLPKKRYRSRDIWLNVLPDDLWLRTPKGQTVWEALQDADIELEGDCGGLGICGKCKIKVLSSMGPPSQEEIELLDEEELEQGIRLACHTEIEKDLVIYCGKPDSDIEYFQILRTGYQPCFQPHPLVNQQAVTLLPNLQGIGLPHLEQVRLALGSEYQDLRASLPTLRALPQMFEETGYDGVAVLHEKSLMAWQNRDKVTRQYGLAFDIGTSTLVGKLINLLDGSEVAAICCLNSQFKHSSNVIGRLQYIKEHQNGLDHLHRLLIKDMNLIIKRLLEVGELQQDDIFVAVAVGNTTMQHFLLDLSPATIAEAPFAPVLTDGVIVNADDVGLELHPAALLYVMPAKSGYVGGDLISVVMASGVAEQNDEIMLGLDLGTNGEIFLGSGRRLLTCSAAAGPALEGGGISCGMIAKAGAIESVSFEGGSLHYLVIGNISPRGICGSGLVELVAVLLELGIIDHEGLIRPPEKKVAENLRPRVVKRAGVYDFLIASAEESHDHRPLYLTQKDVRELQLAKAAIAAGVETLMGEMGIGPEGINRLYLAGALGNYINPYSAMRIGLIPRVDSEIITSLGNAASTGASMILLSKEYWQMANKLAAFIEYVELSSHLNFNENFIEQMGFPQENLLDIYREEMEDNVMRAIRAEEIMTRNFPTVSSTMPVEELSNWLRNTGHHGFPVLNEKGHLFGIVTLADLASGLRSQSTGLTIGDIATRKLSVAYTDQSLYEVLRAIAEDYGRIPVVDRHDRNRLVGVLRRHDIMTAYRRALAQTGKAEPGFPQKESVVSHST